MDFSRHKKMKQFHKALWGPQTSYLLRSQTANFVMCFRIASWNGLYGFNTVEQMRKKVKVNAVKKWNHECSKIFGPAITGSYRKKKLINYAKSHNVKISNKQTLKQVKQKLQKDLTTKKPTSIEDHERDNNNQENSLSHTIDDSLTTAVDTKSFVASSHSSLDSLIKFPMVLEITKSSLDASLSSIAEYRAQHCSVYPSVTAILNATRPPEAQFFLDRWQKKMIEELGEEGFRKYQQGKNNEVPGSKCI